MTGGAPQGLRTGLEGSAPSGGENMVGQRANGLGVPHHGARGADLILTELRPVDWSGLELQRTLVEGTGEATFVDAPREARDRWFPDAILPNEWQETIPWEVADRMRLGWKRGAGPPRE